MFLSGNDANAKMQVAGLLREMGWKDILDLGDISTARGSEMMLPMGHSLMRLLDTMEVAIKIVR